MAAKIQDMNKQLESMIAKARKALKRNPEMAILCLPSPKEVKKLAENLTKIRAVSKDIKNALKLAIKPDRRLLRRYKRKVRKGIKKEPINFGLNVTTLSLNTKQFTPPIFQEERKGGVFSNPRRYRKPGSDFF